MVRVRAWSEAKENEKSEIARVNAEAREREMGEAKERVREKANAVQRSERRLPPNN